MPTNQQWLPSDIQAQMLEQQKKQAMAQALLGSIPTAQPQMVGGRYISPGIGGAITNVAKALMDGKLQQDQLQSQADILRGMSGKWDMGSPESLIKAGMTPKSVKQYINNGDGTQLQKQPKEAGYSDFRYVDGGKTDVDPATGLKRVEVLYADGTRGMKPVPGGQTFNLGQDPYLKAAAGVQTKDINDMSNAAMAAKTNNAALTRVQEILASDKPMVLGPTGDWRMAAKSFWSAMTGQDMPEVDNTAEAKAAIIHTMAGFVKQIGGAQVSDKDLETALFGSGGDFRTTRAALRRIIGNAITRNKATMQQFESALQGMPESANPQYWLNKYNGPVPKFNPEDMGTTVDGATQQSIELPPTGAPTTSIDSLKKFQNSLKFNGAP